MKVTPGSLPDDGQRINTENDLTAFVTGTRLFDFGFPEFAESGVAFLISSTDPPATAARHRAITWFKRGEGTLYHWFVFTPNTGPDSGVTQGLFLAGSGSRKDIATEVMFPVVSGRPVFIDSRASENHYQEMHHAFMMPRVSGDQFTSHTDGSVVSDASASIQAFWHERHKDPCFVLLETASGFSGRQYRAAAEVGYVDAVVGCDYTGPSKLIFQFGENVSRFLTDPGVTVRVTEPYAAHGVESGVSDRGTLSTRIFLKPTMSHRDH